MDSRLRVVGVEMKQLTCCDSFMSKKMAEVGVAIFFFILESSQDKFTDM